MPGNTEDDEKLVLVGCRTDALGFFDHFPMCRYAAKMIQYEKRHNHR